METPIMLEENRIHKPPPANQQGGVDYSNYLRSDKMPTLWCSGCGDGLVMKALIRAVDELEWDRNDVAVVSGIGCSGRMSSYLDFNTLHTPHGRTLPFASGLKLVKPDERFIKISYSPVSESDEGNMGQVWAFSDITAIIKAEEQLHTIVEASPIPLLISAVEDGKIIYANENLAALGGYLREETVGKYTSEFYYDPRERQVLVEELKKSGYVKNRELKLKKSEKYILKLLKGMHVLKAESP